MPELRRLSLPRFRCRLQEVVAASRVLQVGLDGLLEGGVRVGYKTDRFDIAGFVRNITNDASPTGGIDFNNLTSYVNEPRIWGVEAGVKF